MKAIRVTEFGDPEVLKIADLPDPVPGPGQVLIRLEAIGVNPVETYIRAGTYRNKPELPYTPGTDGAGTVEAVGAGVTAFRPGDRVYTTLSLNGTYAAKTLCLPEQIYPLPAQISFSQGAALGVPYGTAYRALVPRGHAQAGETVLIHGASGSVGMAGIEIARILGLHVLGTAGSEEGQRLVLKKGAHAAFNHGKAGYLEEIREATGGKGVDLILEMLANKNLANDLTLLASKNGRVLVVGNRGPIEIDPRQAMVREADIRGVTLWGASPAERVETHAFIRKGLESGALQPRVAKEMPLAEAPRAHRELIEGGVGGKIVLLPG